MPSLVIELQRQALDSKTRVSDMLRTALVVATKLDISELREWCQRELNGYADHPVPPYRRIKGTIKALNPMRGWIPVAFPNAELGEQLATRAAVQPVSELEALVAQKGKGALVMSFPQSVLNDIFGDSEEYGLGIVPHVLIGRNQLVGILDSVRTAVLDWTLELEKRGVVGEGMTFTKEEKTKASTVTYNIGTFSGVLGDVQHSAVQVGDYTSISADLKRLGVTKEERHELEEVLDDLPAAHGEKKAALLTRGANWLMRNASAIGTLSNTVRGWLEHYGKLPPSL